MSLTFPRDINYAKDDSGITKLIGATSEGFGALYASKRDTGLYGVLELQDWANDTPPATKTATDFEVAGRKRPSVEFNQLFSSVIKPYTNQNPALILTGNPMLHAILDGRRRTSPEAHRGRCRGGRTRCLCTVRRATITRIFKKRNYQRLFINSLN
ncbi:MAG: hypothetical protein LBK73_10225 [Treponema sp.]|nr:hypothetical protein [Treponema sp.]